MPRLRLRQSRHPRTRQAGFTIIELLIAMSIFVVILLTAVSVFIQVSKLYYKGVTVSRTQEAARAIMDDLTREIQFSSSRVVANAAGTPRVYCVGSRRYSYLINTMKTENPAVGQSRHALQKDIIPTSGGCPTPSVDGQGAVLPGGATELMVEGTSLTDLDITCSTDFISCTIHLRMTYGDVNDNSLFTDEGGRRVCRGGIVGSEYCTVVELNTTVTRRIR